MAELVDALDSGSSRGNSVDVRLILAAIKIRIMDKENTHAKSIALIANGNISNYPLIKSLILRCDRCVAVDGGLIHCDTMDIVPDLIIGDFDSTPAHLLERYSTVQRLQYPVDKDQTDLELAFTAVNQPSTEKVVIFGGCEGRTDHLLSNLLLLDKYPSLVSFETDYETITAITHQRDYPCKPGQTISLIPYNEAVSGVTTQNLKWELQDAELDRNFISLSNICLHDSFSVSIKRGTLLCFQIRQS